MTHPPLVSLATLLVAAGACLSGVCFSSRSAGGQQPPGGGETDSATPDRIWVVPTGSDDENRWYPEPIRQLRGKVLEYGPQAMKFMRVGGDTAESLPAQRILWVEPGQRSEFEGRGLKLFAAGRFGEALPVLIDAIGTRPPVWHQQWLSMVAAQSAWRSSRSEVALELVSQIDRRPITPLVLAWLPVDWGAGPASRAAADAAAARLSNPSPAVRLVAASWVLKTERGRATQVLRLLALERERPWIAKLAAVLLWRTAPPPEVGVSREKWRAEVDALPLVLQVGPTVTLMDRLDAAGQRDAAAELRRSLRLTRPHPHPELLELAADGE